MTRQFAEGDRVLLVDNKKRRHLITLEAGGQFHTHAGIVEHDSIIGGDDGLTVRTTRGARLIAVRPTLSEYVLEMPRGAQVIYPKDLGPILMLADIFPGARILESGVGSGALDLRTPARDRHAGPRDRLRDPRRLRRPRAAERARLPRRRRAARRRGPRRVRRHRGAGPRSRRARPARAVARGEARGRGAAARAASSSPTSRRSCRSAGCARSSRTRRSAWSRRSRSCSAPGTSRASRSGPTTAWSPTRGSSPTRGCSCETPEPRHERARRRHHRGGARRRRRRVAARVRRRAFAWARRRARPRRSACTTCRASSPRSAAPAPTTGSRSRCCSSCWSRRSGRRSVSASASIVHRFGGDGQPLPRWDRFAGAAIGTVGVLALVWMTIPSLATAKGWPARMARGSSVVVVHRLARADASPRSSRRGAAPSPMRRTRPRSVRSTTRPIPGRPPDAVIPAEVDARRARVDREGERPRVPADPRGERLGRRRAGSS